VFATDSENRITFVNHSAEKIFDRMEADLIGRPAHEHLKHTCPDGSSHSPEDCPFNPGREHGIPEAGEEFIIRGDGLKTPISFFSNPLRQEGRLIGSLVSFNDISDRIATEERIHQLAFFDSLTQLPNRRLLLDRLGQSQAVSARQQLFGAVLFIDVDGFKDINDTLGHEFGDALLCELARRLRTELREEDTVARFGGDEFVVILESLDIDQSRAAVYAKRVADKILISQRQPFSMNGKDCHTSVSIGVVIFRGHDEVLDEILKRSDIAMYEAKKLGRNQARFFDPAMQMELEKRTRVESDLGQAIAAGQFKLYYQKRVDCLGKTLGAEGLLRWVHPERGFVSPAEFIPLSEKTGQIVPIGRWVLQEACRRLKSWEKNGFTQKLMLSINVSTREFRHDDFVPQVLATLDESGLNGSSLEMEITEGMMLDNIEGFIRKMDILRERGITFSLDDFGTGYSSLSYLKKLPIHTLKIDQSFVRELVTDKNDEAIVRTIIQIGQTLCKEVIAEGVETPAQRLKLEQLGCRHFQGYLFGKPVPVDIFESEHLSEQVSRV